MRAYKPNCFVAFMTDGEGYPRIVVEIMASDANARVADVSIADGDAGATVDELTVNLGEAIEQLAVARDRGVLGG